MTQAVSNRIQDHRATLSLAGRFDFSIHRDFRRNYEEILAAPSVRELEVDLSNVNYIDSSALGMLLLLREKATARNMQLSLAHAQDSVRQVLEVANFGRLFQLV